MSEIDPGNPAETDATPHDEGEAIGDSDGLVFTCPSCSEPIVLTEAPANGLVECPACGAQFFAAADPDDIEADARAEAEAEAALGRREAELSELRVRQVSTLRRSMIRSRSYFITGAWACIIAAAELAWFAGLRYREFLAAKAAGIHVGITSYFIPITEIACMFPALLASRYFFRRARQAAIELKAAVMKDPETPPDLSTLGGGIEPWRGLEEMHEGSGDDSARG